MEAKQTGKLGKEVRIEDEGVATFICKRRAEIKHGQSIFVRRKHVKTMIKVDMPACKGT